MRIERNRQRSVLTRPASLDGTARDVTERVQSDNGETQTFVRKRASVCASCGRALSDQNPEGGICFVCVRVVCLECGKKPVCCICNRVVCNNNDCSVLVNEKVCCRTHTFWEFLKLEFVRHR